MIEIKKATISDLEIIQSISTESFIQTFASINTPENMEHYIQESFNTTQLTLEINNPASPFYIAFVEVKPVGYLKLNTGIAQTEVLNDLSLEIQRIYVLQEFHGLKIGQLLLDQAIKVAQQTAVDYIWLGVWEENHKAIQFYIKNGFLTFGKHIFTLGNDQQTDLLMKLNTKN